MKRAKKQKEAQTKRASSQEFRKPRESRSMSGYREVLYEINPKLYHPTSVHEKHRILEDMKKRYNREQKNHNYLK